MSKTKRVVGAVLAAVLLISGVTGCKGDAAKEQGNIREIRELGAGDTYAIMRVRDYDGELVFLLFDEIAPIGVEKFITAANGGYYDGKTFHRVLEDMMIQGGALNMDGSDATIPPTEYFEIETSPNARNFFGALAFAKHSEANLNYRQFYIVTANKPVDIDKIAEKLAEDIENADTNQVTNQQLEAYRNLQKELSKLPADVKEAYLDRGGLQQLDGEVTVFGQLVTGAELLLQLAGVEVVAGNVIDDNNPDFNDGRGIHSRPATEIFIETIRIVRIEDESASTTSRR